MESSTDILSLRRKTLTRDEFMAAAVGDCTWLELALNELGSEHTYDKHGLAPLHVAALHGQLNCLKLLVEKFKVDVNLPSLTGWRALQLAVNNDHSESSLACVTYLLENGADVNLTNNENYTVTHRAATEGLIDCLRLLLEHNAPIDVLDAQYQNPYNLARIWGHKECALLIQQEGWKREKEVEAREYKKLDNMKSKYKQLQQEALDQLKTDQEFYDKVTFGNWLEQKGFTGSDGDVSRFDSEKHADKVTSSLAQRLQHGSSIADYSARVESLYSGRKQTMTATREKAMFRGIAKAAHKLLQKRRNMEGSRSLREEMAESKAKSRMSSGHVKRGKLGERDSLRMSLFDWNSNTNVNSYPYTNIKNADSIALSIKPSEDEFPILPTTANLPVTLEIDEDNKVALKVLRPGGIVETVDVDIPCLPIDVIRKALLGKRFVGGISEGERIQVPQEFRCIHIFDVVHKRRPKTRLTTEVPWHLKMFKDGCCIECDCTPPPHVYDQFPPFFY